MEAVPHRAARQYSNRSSAVGAACVTAAPPPADFVPSGCGATTAPQQPIVARHEEEEYYLQSPLGPAAGSGTPALPPLPHQPADDGIGLSLSPDEWSLLQEVLHSQHAPVLGSYFCAWSTLCCRSCCWGAVMTTWG